MKKAKDQTETIRALQIWEGHDDLHGLHDHKVPVAEYVGRYREYYQPSDDPETQTRVGMILDPAKGRVAVFRQTVCGDWDLPPSDILVGKAGWEKGDVALDGWRIDPNTPGDKRDAEVRCIIDAFDAHPPTDAELRYFEQGGEQSVLKAIEDAKRASIEHASAVFDRQAKAVSKRNSENAKGSKEKRAEGNRLKYDEPEMIKEAVKLADNKMREGLKQSAALEEAASEKKLVIKGHALRYHWAKARKKHSK